MDRSHRVNHFHATFAAMIAALTGVVTLPVSGRSQCADYAASPTWVAGLSVEHRVAGFAIAGTYAYVGGGTLQIVDISDPSAPDHVGGVWVTGRREQDRALGPVAVVSSYAFSAVEITSCFIDPPCTVVSHAIRVVDVSDPMMPRIVESVFPGRVEAIEATGSHLYSVGTRGFVIVDIADPTSPSIIGTLDAFTDPRDLVVAGRHVYGVDANAGLLIIDVSDPTSPELVLEVPMPESSEAVAFAGGYVYVAGGGMLTTVDLRDLTEVFGSRGTMTRASGPPHVFRDEVPYLPRTTVPTPGHVKDIAISDGSAYLTDHTWGVTRVDVTDPLSPQFLGSLAAIWADDIVVSGGYAYVGNGSLQIFDVRGVWPPVGIGTSLETPGFAWDVAVEEDHAYVADGSSVQVVRVDGIGLPEIVGSLATPAWTVAFEGHRGVVAAAASGLRVLDVSDPAVPEITGSAGLPGSARTVAVRGDYAYVGTDVGFSGLHIVDISDSYAPRVEGSVSLPDHPRDVAVAGNHAYVAATGQGLRVIDVSVPASPVTVASFFGQGEQVGVVLDGQYAYVASEAWLHVIDVSVPTEPALVGKLSLNFRAMGITVEGGSAYLAADRMGLAVVDVTVPEAPRLVGTAATPGPAYGIAVSRDLVYLADGSLHVLPTHCQQWGRNPLPERALGASAPELSGPRRIALGSARPNPFRLRTTLDFHLSSSQTARLAVFDVSGRLVRTLVRGKLGAGDHSATWDGRADAGRSVASGTYFVRLEAKEVARTQKVVWLGRQ